MHDRDLVSGIGSKADRPALLVGRLLTWLNVGHAFVGSGTQAALFFMGFANSVVNAGLAGVIAIFIALLALASTTGDLTIDRARALSPTALADTLLGPDHPPISTAIVHPIGMEPPTASLQRVDMFGVAHMLSDRPRWCSRTAYTVTLEPRDPQANIYTEIVPTKVSKVEPRSQFRVTDEACDDADAMFFEVDPTLQAAQFSLVNRLRDAKVEARSLKRLSFQIYCEDRTPDTSGDKCVRGGGRTLLSNLPIDRIIHVPTSRTVFLDDRSRMIEITFGISGAKTTSVAIRRFVPPPF